MGFTIQDFRSWPLTARHEEQNTTGQEITLLKKDTTYSASDNFTFNTDNVWTHGCNLGDNQFGG